MQAAQSIQGPQVAVLLAEVIERLMRPVIRLLVGRVSCQFIVQMVKRIYIEEARIWIGQHSDKGRVTKSKLALLTGLDTRTIESIESTSIDIADMTASDVCVEAAVLHEWSTDSDYRDDQGRPMRLRVFGRPRTFETLTRPLVGRGVTCQTVLDRLVQAGNVRIVEDDFVEMIKPFYEPVEATEASILEAGSWSIARLCFTLYANLNTPEFDKRLIQRDRYTFTIPSEDYDGVRAKVRKTLEEHVQAIEKILGDAEVDGAENGKCLGVGWYMFT